MFGASGAAGQSSIRYSATGHDGEKQLVAPVGGLYRECPLTTHRGCSGTGGKCRLADLPYRKRSALALEVRYSSLRLKGEGNVMRRFGVVLASCLALARCAAPRETSVAFAVHVIDGHSDFAVHYLRQGWSVEAHDIARWLCQSKCTGW